MKNLLLMSALLLTFYPLANAQLLNKIIKKTTDKVVDKAADMAAEKISDAIAAKFYRSLDQAFDNYLQEVMKEDSLYKATYGDSSYADLANKWVSQLNRAADVPPTYDFNLSLNVISTHKGDETAMELYFSDHQVLGFKQEDDGEERMMVFDMEKDVTVMYTTDKKGKKTAQALPNMFKMGMAIAESSMQNHYDSLDIDCSDENQTKMIAGYTCNTIACQDDKHSYITHFTTELPIDWKDAYQGIFERFAKNSYMKETEKYNGMFLASYSYTGKKKKKKLESSWVTQEVSQKPFSIVNGDWEFTGIEE